MKAQESSHLISFSSSWLFLVESIVHLSRTWTFIRCSKAVFIAQGGDSVRCKTAPCFSSQASRSHSFSQETTMQGSIGLSRLVKSCVGHKSVYYCTSTNSSWAESFRQNGFIDQAISLLMSYILESHNYIIFCTLGSCDDPTEPHSSEISAQKAGAGTRWPPTGSTIKVGQLHTIPRMIQTNSFFFQPTLALSRVGLPCLVKATPWYSIFASWPRSGKLYKYHQLGHI